MRELPRSPVWASLDAAGLVRTRREPNPGHGVKVTVQVAARRIDMVVTLAGWVPTGAPPRVYPCESAVPSDIDALPRGSSVAGE